MQIYFRHWHGLLDVLYSEIFSSYIIVIIIKTNVYLIQT